VNDYLRRNINRLHLLTYKYILLLYIIIFSKNWLITNYAVATWHCFRAVLPPHSFIRSFVRADLVTTISHERLEESRCSLMAYSLDILLLSLAPIDDLIRFWRSKVKVTAGRGMAKVSTSTMWRRSTSSSFNFFLFLLILYSYSYSLFILYCCSSTRYRAFVAQ